MIWVAYFGKNLQDNGRDRNQGRYGSLQSCNLRRKQISNIKSISVHPHRVLLWQPVHVDRIWFVFVNVKFGFELQNSNVPKLLFRLRGKSIDHKLLRWSWNEPRSDRDRSDLTMSHSPAKMHHESVHFHKTKKTLRWLIWIGCASGFFYQGGQMVRV